MKCLRVPRKPDLYSKFEINITKRQCFVQKAVEKNHELITGLLWPLNVKTEIDLYLHMVCGFNN